MKTELLAPAGDKEAAYSAFYFGADAIYLGLKKFSARAEAINFSKEDLDEITAYAHHMNKKVYVAINTLMQSCELEQLMESLQTCVECKVDAVIVQDLGVARIVKKCFPSLALHASTQMAVHNLAGAIALKKMGFERVVLARELSLQEIQEIKEKSGVEIEVFIHGALCYSYSGLCLFSSLTTTRSANRGKCVYSCRSMFSRNNKKTHLFSMKDIALEKDVLKLEGLSLKIEGRKKTPLYVGAVTDYYRRILDTGNANITLTDNLKQIFARPWTKLHFNGKNKDVIDEYFVGHRGLKIGNVEKIFEQKITFKTNKNIARYDGIQIEIEGIEKPFGFSVENIVVGKKSVFEAEAGKTVTINLPKNSPFIKKGSSVYLASSTKVKSSYDYKKPKPKEFINRTPIDVHIFVEKNLITAYSCEVSATIENNFDTAKQPVKVENMITDCFKKTGEYAFYLENLEVENKNNLFVPLSIANELRRKLYAQIKFDSSKKSLPQVKGIFKNQKQRWAIKTDQLETLKHVNLTNIDDVILEINSKTSINDIACFPKEKVILSLPVIIRNQNVMQKKVNEFSQKGYNKWQIGNIGGFAIIPQKSEIYVDTTIGILNEEAMAFMFDQNVKEITFSSEDTEENIKALTKFTNQTSLIVYQDIPLFISANCVRENKCSECTQGLKIDEIKNGKDGYLLISKNCETRVVKNTPFYISKDMFNLNVRTYRIDFCNKEYSKDEMENLINLIQMGKKIKNTFTGNFKKNFA